MEKTLIIDGRPVTFKSSGAFLLRYKMQFHRDAIRDLGKLCKAMSEKTVVGEDGKEHVETVDMENIDLKDFDFDKLDLEVFINMAWTLARTANPSIPGIMEWLDSFEEFPVFEVLPEIMDLLQKSISGSKKK